IVMETAAAIAEAPQSLDGSTTPPPPEDANEGPGDAPPLSAEERTSSEEARRRTMALHLMSAEDARRMRFLALLCGRMGERTVAGAIGEGYPSKAFLGGDATSTTTSAPSTETTSGGGGHRPDDGVERHRRGRPSGVGYLDESVPLLLSSMADRFLATVLVQGMACRDRRLEGYDELLRERRRRRRHRARVLGERRERERRFRDEMNARRERAEAAVADAVEVERQMKEQINSKKGNKGGGAVSSLPSSYSAAIAVVQKTREAQKQTNGSSRGKSTEEP
ncbi:hypothetical protein ACHAXA_008312, partial [Cyclostephanos tholiformis]